MRSTHRVDASAKFVQLDARALRMPGRAYGWTYVRQLQEDRGRLHGSEVSGLRDLSHNRPSYGTGRKTQNSTSNFSAELFYLVE